MKRQLLLPTVLLLVLSGFSGCFGGIASDWAYKMVGLRAMQGDFDGKDINVAIIDTGINIGHPSLDHLKDRLRWKDFVNNKPDPYDDVGHGTHVSGIVAGKGSNFGGRVQGFDMKGGAPEANLLVAKVIRAEDGKGSTEDVVAAIDWAIQEKADVICMSLGGNPVLNLPVNEMQNSINIAVNQGIMVAASAGNYREGEARPEDVAVPARLEDVVAVGAVNSDKKLADFSVRGSESANQGFGGPLGGVGARSDPHKKPEIVAPGVGIRSAWTGDQFAIAEGTSQATPFVCSAFALLFQKCSNLRAANNSGTVERIKTALRESAEPIPGQRTPHDNGAGYGLLRADRLGDKFQTPC